MHQPWAGPVASHASAAALHGIGDLLADRAEFALPSALPRDPAVVTLHVAPCHQKTSPSWRASP